MNGGSICVSKTFNKVKIERMDIRKHFKNSNFHPQKTIAQSDVPLGLPSGIKGKNSCQIPILQKNANLKGIPWPPKMIWGWELWDGSRMELK